MTYAKFKSIVWELRREFTRYTGSVAFCRGKAGVTVSVCCGCVSNTGILPTKCLVWAGEDLLYSGELCSKTLCKILTKRNLCLVTITNVMDMENKQPKTYLCVGDFAKCKKKTCPCKKRAEEERRRCRA